MPRQGIPARPAKFPCPAVRVPLYCQKKGLDVLILPVTIESFPITLEAI